jgi:hypothetical protein
MINKLTKILLVFTLFVINTSCKKIFTTYPTIRTKPAINLTSTSFTTGGEITDEGGADIIEKGICWVNRSEIQYDSVNGNYIFVIITNNAIPTVDNNKIIINSNENNYNYQLSGLNYNNTYCYRAYAKNSSGYLSYGEMLLVNTKDTSNIPPEVLTLNPSSITSSSVNTGCSIQFDGGSPISQKGICWSTSPNPTINSNFQELYSNLTYSITGLNPNTQYYFRAYAKNWDGYAAYGNQVTCRTLP